MANRTSIIAVILGLVILVGEFLLVFSGAANPANAIAGMALTIINGVIMAFALLLLLIGVMLAAG